MVTLSIPSFGLVLQTVPWQSVLLALLVSLLTWMAASYNLGISAVWWALAVAGLNVGSFLWLHRRYPPQVTASSAGQLASELQTEQQILDNFQELDDQIITNLGKISDLSSGSMSGIVERVGDVYHQSEHLIRYLQDAGIQSGKIQEVIDKNTQIIDFLYQFIGQLEHKVEDERLHSNKLLGEVKQFADMTQVIRSIARQTEILAINARIEAARAGEAGHGFAVLAGEVRRLSIQSNETAAKIEEDIACLIKTVQHQVAMDMEEHITEEELSSKNLLELTKQLSDSYLDIRDFYQILMTSVTESNVKLGGSIQELLDLVQYQDVFKQIIDRVPPVFLQRHECLRELLLNAAAYHEDATLAQQLVDKLKHVMHEYRENEMNHGGPGELVDKHTGETLDRIELF